MATPVIMPRQGQSVESCIFSEWFIQIGDNVQKGDLLFAYETDKAAFEAEAPENGTLLATFAEPGDAIPVLQNIGVIGKPGEAVDPFKPGHPEERIEDKEEKEIPVESQQEKPAVVSASTTEETKISPRARKAARGYHLNLSNISGTGPEGRIIERDVINEIKRSPKATPLAKSIAFADHVDLPSSGTGPGGKVLADDVKKAGGIIPAQPTIQSGTYQDEKLSNIRKIIATNMQNSLQNTAQLTLHTSADARRIQSLRKKFKKEAEEHHKPNITINDLVCYATVKVLKKHPEINAHFLGDAIRHFGDVHLGFAVDTERGLMVPTLAKANHLTLEGLAVQMKELASQAQSGKINPELLTGATCTVTNLGVFGIEMFTPVLNPPQVAILGLNTIIMHPSPLEDGSFGFIPKIGLSLTFDHRAIDGAPAAAFLRDVKLEIENFEIS
jgi:pyruvate dehydrogenase E2 component (dihydrolipoamide acetyltransferase)